MKNSSSLTRLILLALSSILFFSHLPSELQPDWSGNEKALDVTFSTLEALSCAREQRERKTQTTASFKNVLSVLWSLPTGLHLKHALEAEKMASVNSILKMSQAF